MTHPFTRPSLGLGLPALLLALLLTASFPVPGRAAEKAATRLHQVKRQIESHREKIDQTHIKALNLEQELNRIASQIKKGQETVSELQAKLRRQEDAIRRKEAEIAAIRTAKEAAADHIRKRLAAFYQTGEVGIVNALFSVTNLGELLNLQVYVQALFQYDQQVLQGYRDQIGMLAKAKEELTRAKAALQGLIGQVRAGEIKLGKSREARDKLLAQARAEEKLYRNALKELERAAARLAKTIRASRPPEIKTAKKKLSRPGGRGLAPATQRDTGFATRQGRLPPPARGQIIRGFGPYQDHFGNRLKAAGVDLAIPPGTTVTAIHDGRVIFSDQMAGYGKLVIIDHGSQYYTLVSGLDRLTQKRGADVRAGDALGTFGQPTGLINPGLHVEIRHGATPVDPLLWLDRGQLNF